MFQPGSAGYFVPTMPQAQRTYFAPNNMPTMRSNPRWQTTVRPAGQPGSGFQTMPGAPTMRQQRPTSQTTVRSGVNARPITGQSGTPNTQQRMPVSQQVGGRPQGGQPNVPAAANRQAGYKGYAGGQMMKQQPGQNPGMQQVHTKMGENCLTEYAWSNNVERWCRFYLILNLQCIVNCFLFTLGTSSGCDCPGTGSIDSHHVGHCSTPGAETDVGRALVPAHLTHVPRSGRQNHRHVAWDWQLWVAAHVGIPGVSGGQGRHSNILKAICACFFCKIIVRIRCGY